HFNGVQILISGADRVQGCFIGTDPAGTIDLGNLRDGVSIIGPPDNIIGGASAADRNVISGNNLDGVEINSVTSTGNDVWGNFIGTKKNGTEALGNTVNGVQIVNAPNNRVGAGLAGSRNVISGNG